MSKEAFIQGFRDATEGTVYDPTPRQVEEARPEYTRSDVTAYLNGVNDAFAHDTFRLRLCYCVHPDQQWCDCDWCRLTREMASAANTLV